MKLEIFNNTKCIVGEGPVWDSINRRLLFLDIRGKCIYKTDYDTGRTERIDLPQRIGCFTLAENGDILAGLEDGVYRIDKGGNLTPAHQPIKIKGDRFNDGKSGPDGAFYLGTSAADGCGAFYRLKDGVLTELFDGCACSNGLDWTADGKQMYYIDTPRQMVELFDFDKEKGEISSRRKFVDIPREWGLPDGMTLDSDGNLWVALWDGSNVIQIDKTTKEIINKIRIPCRRASCCAFGGKNMDELFITSAAFGDEQNEMSGKTFKIKVNATGGKIYRYKG